MHESDSENISKNFRRRSPLPIYCPKCEEELLHSNILGGNKYMCMRCKKVREIPPKE